MISSLLDFLKNPRKLKEIPNLNLAGILSILFFALIVIVPYALILEYLGIDEFDHLMEDMLANHTWLVIIMAVILAPIIEETIFRHHLILTKPSIAWGIILSILVISEYWYLVAGFIVYMLYLFFRVKRENLPKLKYVIFISSFFFAIVHLGNFSEFDFVSNFYWIPFLVIPQFFIGLILSYLRIHYGLMIAMLFHGAYNAALVIPAVYFLDNVS